MVLGAGAPKKEGREGSRGWGSERRGFGGVLGAEAPKGVVLGVFLGAGVPKEGVLRGVVLGAGAPKGQGSGRFSGPRL